jgi:hypothetical protein
MKTSDSKSSTLTATAGFGVVLLGAWAIARVGARPPQSWQFYVLAGAVIVLAGAAFVARVTPSRAVRAAAAEHAERVLARLREQHEADEHAARVEALAVQATPDLARPGAQAVREQVAS